MTDWAKLKVVDLKAELKRRDLPQHGLKAELVARLTAADEEAEAEAPPAETANEEEQKEDAEEEKTTEEPMKEDGDAPAVVEEATEETPVPTTTTANEPVEETPANDAPEHKQVPQPEESEAQVPDAVETSAPAPEATQTDKEEPQVEKPEPQFEAPPQPQPEVKAQDNDDSMVVDSSTSMDVPKRKRSASPPPDEDAIAKRARKSDVSADAAIAPAVNMADKPPSPPTKISGDAVDTPMETDRTVSPSIHPATPALYIANLMRPLRPNDMQTHLIDLATPPRASPMDDIITTFHLDQIRTHALVVFTSTSAASRVRTLLHDAVWPNESNRKALFVDFVPADKVEGWIETETAAGGGRSGARWQVSYTHDGPDGAVEAHLESATASLSRPPQGPPPSNPSIPTGPRVAPGSINNIPLGPRGAHNPSREPPTGPRAKPSGPGPFPNRGDEKNIPSAGSRRTDAHPSISYTPVSDGLARRRLDNMHSFYTDRRGPYGREINRYSFEDGDSFVDRGKEIFEGIRPPHRERGGRGGRGGGGFGGRRGGGGRGRGRPRGDRFIGGESRRLSPPPMGRDDRW